MVIQCPECQARFKMADEKARNGVKVRCSRCQHVFAVQLPEAVPTAIVENAATSAQSQPLAEKNSPSETLTSADSDETAASPSEFGAFSFDKPEETGSADGGLGIDGFDLADFSVDTGISTPDAKPGDSDELDLGSFDMAADSPFTMGAAADQFPLNEESPASEFSFGKEGPGGEIDFSSPQAEDFSFDNAADFSFDEGSPPTFDDVEKPERQDTAEEGFSAPSKDAFSFGDLSPDSAFAISQGPSGNEETGIDSTWSSGAGPNDEFDFAPAPPANEATEFDFSNLSFGEENPPSSAPPLSPAISEILPPLPSVPASPAAEEKLAPPGAEEEELILPPPMKRKKSAFSGLLGVLIVLLLLLSGVAGYFFWQGGVPEFSTLIASLSGKTQASVAAGQIQLTDLNGYFIDNAEVGQLFVIQGKVVNEYSAARSAIAVKGVLYNQAGQPLMQQTVFPGNKLDDNALRTLPFGKIEESMNNQFGDSLSNLNIAPGKSIPFTIIFRNLPTGLAEFAVEVTDSKPGGG